jgi:hypothetical protein
MPRIERVPSAHARRSACEGEFPRSIPPSARIAPNENPRAFVAASSRRRHRGMLVSRPAVSAQRASVSRGERRRRVHKVDTRFDALEHAALVAAAHTTGLTKGGYIRALVLGCPGPRSQRTPSVNAQALAHATAALNKVGSNLNQIARVLNSGGSETTTRACQSALANVQAAVESILRIAGRGGRT